LFKKPAHTYEIKQLTVYEYKRRVTL